MKEKTVVIEIDEQGNSTIDLDGFQGKGCGDVAKALQGQDVVKTQRTKADFYVQETAAERRQRRS
jgi:hypothetical protein